MATEEEHKEHAKMTVSQKLCDLCRVRACVESTKVRSSLYT